MNLSPPPVREEMYRDGQMTTPWVRFFDVLYQRVGGTGDPLTTEIENRASDEQPSIVIEEHSYFEDHNTAAAVQASLDMAPVKSVFGRLGNVVSAEGDYSLEQLSNVTLSSPTPKQALAFNGTLFANADIVNSATGTANQISITSGTGDITLSLPDNMSIGGTTGVINISSTVASTSTTTGALIVAGGAGVAGQISCTALAPNAPTTETSNYTLVAADFSLIFNGAAPITLTLPAASSFSGRLLILKNIAAFAVVSASSNVIPITGGAAGAAILPATAGSWCLLQSDGSAWVKMMEV